MARNVCDMDRVTPEDVWGVLADARYYGHWVVGSKRIRDFDADWPAEGSKFHHTVGVGPIKINDHTTAVVSRPPHFLKLRAKARPMGTFFVALQMEAMPGGGTRVTMDEWPADRLTRLIYNPLTRMLIRGRNVGSLARLRDLAEGRGPDPLQSAEG